MKNLFSIQDEYIQTIKAAATRWSHKPGRAGYRFGGHFPRIAAAARRKALADLTEVGFSPEQADVAVKDALGMAWLEFDCENED